MSTEFDREAERIGTLLPRGSRVAILGSASFHHPDSRAFCQDLGRALAEIPGLVLLTGGVRGVGEGVGRAFHRVFEVLDQPTSIFHILPHGPYEWDYGQTLHTGTTMEHRREVLGRLAGCYIVIEGGPGTEHEVGVAFNQGALVIPVGRFGGHAATLYAGQPSPTLVEGSVWSMLGDADARSTDTEAAVIKVIWAWLRLISHERTATQVNPGPSS